MRVLRRRHGNRGRKNCDVLSAVWGWIFLGDGEKRKGNQREKVRTNGVLERKSFQMNFRLVSVMKTSLIHTHLITQLLYNLGDKKLVGERRA